MTTWTELPAAPTYVWPGYVTLGYVSVSFQPQAAASASWAQGTAASTPWTPQ